MSKQANQPISKKSKAVQPDEVQMVEFLGIRFQAARVGVEVWVVGKRLAEALGLAWQPISRDIAKKAVVTELMIVTPDGKCYAMTCIHIDDLPGVLFNIETGKVKEEVRDRIREVQRKAADAIKAAFFPEKYGALVDSVKPALSEHQEMPLAEKLAFIKQSGRFHKVYYHDAYVNSYDLCIVFDNNHDELMRTIATITQQYPETERDYWLVRGTASGNNLPCYGVSQEGFALIAPHLRGDNALKIAYMKRYEAILLEKGRSRFAILIIRRMKQLDCNRQELAYRLGTSKATITRWLNRDAVMPTVKSLVNISRCLDIPLSELLEAAGYNNDVIPLLSRNGNGVSVPLLADRPELEEMVNDLRELSGEELAFMRGTLHGLQCRTT